MILSFHPMFMADRNLICAGRDPGSEELAQISAAKAVILPQGCRQTLYQMAVQNCANVFPDYHTRFQYPGKIGQIELFQTTGVKYPQTDTFSDLAAFKERYPVFAEPFDFDYPLVFKFDWGGEGETVRLIQNDRALRSALADAAEYERSGQKGFLLQEYIRNQNRDLRVVVIDRHLQTYWRVQKDPRRMLTNVRHGGQIDTATDPSLQKKGALAVQTFCRRTGINLAGLDLIFAADRTDPEPYFLEINYFFGRRGLGGSEAYYRMLIEAIHDWLKRKKLK